MTQTEPTQTEPGAEPPVIEDVLALSPLQQGLFSMATLSDGRDDDPYVIAMAADATGRLDADLLRRCAAELLERHANLRASFVKGNLSRAVQVIPKRVDMPWRHVTAADDAELEEIEKDERAAPFTLERGPVIRFLLIEAPQRWRFVVTAHHILIDGWSLPLFMGELLTLYRAGGDVTALPPPPRPYRDYIGWLAGRDDESGRALWRRHLAGVDGPTLMTPALTSSAPSGRPRLTEVMLDAETTGRLAEAARSRGVTLNTLIQMSWATVLSVVTARTDVVFGVTVSGRPGELAGVERMVGLFINTVPLRVRLDPGAPTGEQCLALQREAAALRDHSYLSHTALRALGGIGEMFDTLLVYENFPPGGLVGQTEFEANGATFVPSALESLSHFPVTIAAHLADDRLTVFVEAVDGALGALRPDDLGRRVLHTAGRLIDCWERPLRAAGVLLPAEYPPGPVTLDPATAHSIHDRFTRIAGDRLGSVALTWEAGGDCGTLTYRELDEAADRMAVALIAAGVGPEIPVAVLLPRGPDYVVAMFGVLKAGGVIVPLDPAMPGERITDILEQSGAAVVIDDAFVAAVPTAGPPAGYRPARASADQAAYIVFTSGTTGRPKGVVGTHGAVLAYAEDHAEHVLRPAAERIGRPLRVGHAWSFTFDAAWQPLTALLDGHSVHLIGDESQRDAEALVYGIGRFAVDMLDTTPSMFAQLRDFGLLSTVPLAVLALGGEAVSPALWRLIGDECVRTGMTAFNCYGPTETTVEAVVAPIDEYRKPSIGRPTRSMSAYVLDAWLRPVPDGVAGELYLSGRQLTRGYLGRAAETAGRFVADPFTPGARMYRTGDVVRRGADGGLQFLGRADDQVKIRGFRVEPGEIAAVLSEHPAVTDAHVTVDRRGAQARLTAYVAAGVNPPALADLRALMATRLPRYMVPQRVVVLSELPLTSHGKIDEAALAGIAIEDAVSAAPQTPTETALVELLSEVLGEEGVDVEADFLETGLDSIVALTLVQAARRRGIEMRARLMLECNNIRELAAAIDASSHDHAPAPVTDDRFGEVMPAPIMSWMYEYGNFRRFTQNVLVSLPADLPGQRLEQIVQALLDRHDMLRAVLDERGRLVTRAPGAVCAADVLHAVDAAADTALEVEVAAALDRIDPASGSMVQAVWFRQGPPVLALCVHHLATDVVSWYVILGALAQLDAALAAGHPVDQAHEYTTYREWTRRLHERSRTETVEHSREYWVGQLAGPDPELGRRRADPRRDTWASLRTTDVLTDAAVTRAILDRLDHAGLQMRDFLLTALSLTLASWRIERGQPAHHGTLVALEGHGREDALVGGGVDTSTTVGWFTSVYPVRLGAGEAAIDVHTAGRNPAAARTLLRAVARQLAEVPDRGLDYGLLRYTRRDETLAALPDPQVEFNYVGRHDLSADQTAHAWSLITDETLNAHMPAAAEPDLPLRYTFDVISVISGGADGPQLRTSWRWSTVLSDAAEVDRLTVLWQRAVTALAEAL
ncbi:amino acid adenylation domain-containing protein [Mycobacterium sp. SMC-8]|uniref:amino acid adenylation domain-containing protein n=1 Tax=Mycobacterium sp. SMC-8 TaxID=2857060 RepID=UPI0021B18516|nr:amino acid adenylation domain-containing protein [Mycobacterium sp. SMC-8]UXA11689.1 amino acid adenylation domain-containing protein [Mycobacterium sp. SMC-8]